MSIPKWLELARAEVGVKEAPGAANNPVVVQYYADAGHPEIMHDSVPWCAAFNGAMLVRAGYKGSGSLLARSYEAGKYGRTLKEPVVGAIAVMPRGNVSWQGHTGFVDKVERDHVWLIDGNKRDRVSRTRYRKDEIISYVWPNDPVSDAKFARCHAVTAKWEGGYVNHPRDPGGATNYGVTQAVYDDYRADKGLAKRSVKLITDDEVHDIYDVRYWDKVHGDELPVGVDLAVYDFAVNSGPSRAAKFLQRIVGADPDGVIGRKTLAAVAEMNPEDVAAQLCDERLAWLKTLGHWDAFGRGWSNRVTYVRRKAVAWAREVPPDEVPPAIIEPPKEDPRKPGRNNRVYLDKGRRGRRVAELIRDLHKLGYYKGELDDFYWTATEAAVRKFQTDNPPLKVDGDAGPNTLDAIDAAIKKGGGANPNVAVGAVAVSAAIAGASEFAIWGVVLATLILLAGVCWWVFSKK